MPELPEVETVCRGLRNLVLGLEITDVTINRANIRVPIPTDLRDKVLGGVISNVRRRAKYIIVELNRNHIILLHLGMSGRLIVKNPYGKRKHDHVVFKLKDKYLIFNDPRRFGLVTLVEKNQLNSHKFIKNLGLEPLEKEFDGAALHKMLQNKQAPVKNVIMNQNLVVGVGNIYASESLHLSGISPLRKAAKVSLAEAKILAKNIKKVLTKSIENGGSSFSDYVDAKGEKGSFQNEFQVYEQEGENCRKCNKGTIIKIRQAGRSSYYCDSCQK